MMGHDSAFRCSILVLQLTAWSAGIAMWALVQAHSNLTVGGFCLA